jgi:hypothetical protein
MNHPTFSQQDDFFLTPVQAAELLGVKPRQLELWRHKSRGPRYRRFSRLIRYSYNDLKAFADASLVDPSDDRPEVAA